ncbi:DUF6048 family protein [Marivirga arenosa]|uniref:DUF6048 family protein n=1 Tax=Marivirga arenosa TaxID=3059076 RepID=A0AA51N745_9BACT|nr:DUF6048 family protein [Marivirga sp. ABR2-2]WMN07482.1 DUF6048 family protein [Marivirga sp. ABR2-2]
MLKSKLILLILLSFSLILTKVSAQDSTAVNTTEKDRKVAQTLSLGIAFDYLKLHTLLIDESQKWEGALNLKFFDKVSAIGEYGIAELRPEEAYNNADYISSGNYYRVGVDYHLTVIPNNFLLLGLRYAQASFDETISYEIENPVFPNETNELSRPNLKATWFEFVLSSEKNVRRLFGTEIPDILSAGFKFRLKYLQEYDKFDVVEIKNIPGYGRTNIALNPEFNLYIKFRIPLF